METIFGIELSEDEEIMARELGIEDYFEED